MLTELYEINQIVVSAYNSEANGMVKHEHKPLINALFKMTAEGLQQMVRSFDIDIMSKSNNYQKKH
jgi:hypothetical protein